MSDEDGGSGSGDLRMFAIFIFSILLLFLIPVTLWRISTGASSEVSVAQPWEKKVCTTPRLPSACSAWAQRTKSLDDVVHITCIPHLERNGLHSMFRPFPRARASAFLPLPYCYLQPYPRHRLQCSALTLRIVNQSMILAAI